jgi:large subunit ribosomal protein L9
MKVILLDDVAKVGRRGEVRDVSDGFARNYLIPKRLALTASAGNLGGLQHIQKQQDAKAERVKAEAEALRSRIEPLTLEARRQASEEGKLFGSVTSQDVVEFLETHDVKVERRRVQLDEPIKTLGESTVAIRLHPEVTAQLKVTVVRE